MILCFLVFMGSSFFFRSVILSRRRRISFYTRRDSSLALRMTLSSREGQLIKPLRVAEENRIFVRRVELGVFAQLFSLAADEDAAFVDVAQNIVEDFFAFLQLQKAAARIVLHVTFPGAGETL